MSKDPRLPIGGAVGAVLPCPATHRDKLASVLENYGMPELLPEPTTPKASLRAAMVQLFPAPDNKVRHGCFPHKNGSEGYRIGRHDPAEPAHVGDDMARVVAIGTLMMRNLPPKEGSKKVEQQWTGDIKLEPYDAECEKAILAYMRHVQNIVPAGKLRECVTAVAAKMGGRRLIKEQPFLWLPKNVIGLFKSIKTEIELCSARHDKDGNEVPPTRIDVLSVVADEEMARSVVGMLMDMVRDETERVEARLAQETLSDEQAANDITKALAVQAELERYEKLLETPLTELKQRTGDLVLSIASKALDKAALSL
jgi:hypothetical protein